MKLTNVTTHNPADPKITDERCIREALDAIDGIECRTDHHGGWDVKCYLNGNSPEITLGYAPAWGEVRVYTEFLHTHTHQVYIQGSELRLEAF